MARYPTVEQLIEINKQVLIEIKVRKADRSALLLGGKKILENIIKDVKKEKGNVYDKAVVLLRELIQRHPFESGNRRTALVTTAAFLKANNKKIKVVHDVNILQGIREGFYKEAEIKKWLRGGRIRAFKR